MLDDVQAEPIRKLPVEDRWITVPPEVGDVRVRIVRPPGAAGTLPAILHVRGGWVLGNADTHDRLVRDSRRHRRRRRASSTTARRGLPRRDRTGLRQQWIVSEGAAKLDPDRVAVAGDSVGDGMTAALALMANDAATCASYSVDDYPNTCGPRRSPVTTVRYNGITTT